MRQNVLFLATIDWSFTLSVVANIVAVVALIRSFKQFRMDAWLKAEDVFSGSGFIENRARYFSRLPACKPFTDEERRDALQICVEMNRFCNLLRFIGERRALGLWDDPLAKAWVVLKPIVEEERKQRKWPAKWKEFEVWGERALNKLKEEGRDPQNLAEIGKPNAV